MRYLTVGEVLEIYSQVMIQSGGGVGIHDLGALESAVAQPRMTFNHEELYPTIVQKTSALGFSLIQNHPFIDGNKRAGHAAMETFLMFNGYEISSGVDEQTEIVLGVASGRIDRSTFTGWLQDHIVELS
jgi:death on curing protein